VDQTQKSLGSQAHLIVLRNPSFRRSPLPAQRRRLRHQMMMGVSMYAGLFAVATPATATAGIWAIYRLLRLLLRQFFLWRVYKASKYQAAHLKAAAEAIRSIEQINTRAAARSQRERMVGAGVRQRT
jgi:hypothetical protein